MAGTLHDSTPVPELCPNPDSQRSCAENFGHFEITDTEGNPIHSLRSRTFVLLRYIVPPDGEPHSSTRPGRDFHLLSPDLDGTGFDSYTNGSGVVAIDFDDLNNNILWSEDVSFGAPDREGPPDGSWDPNGIGDWDVWFGEDGGRGAGALYQKTLELRNIPENQANRWLYLVTGDGQEWPLSFQRDPLLKVTEVSTDQEEYEIGDTVTVTVEVTSTRNSFNGVARTFTDVEVTATPTASSGDVISSTGGPTPASLASLPPETSQDFVFTYEAIDDGPAKINFYASGENADGDEIFSSGRTADVFVGGRGDLLLEDFQRTTTVTVFGDDSYSPDAPLSFSNTVTNRSAADYRLTVQNDGAETNSFILKVIETPLINSWDTSYVMDGGEVINFLRSSTGLLIADLPPGGSQTIDIRLAPGVRTQDCDELSARFELSLTSGSGAPMDAMIAGAEYVAEGLHAELFANPVEGEPGVYELSLEVRNESHATATSVIPRLIDGSTGAGTFEFDGQVSPSFVSESGCGGNGNFHPQAAASHPGDNCGQR